MVTSGYRNYQVYGNEIKNHTDLPFPALIHKYANENVNASVYNMRANILCQVFKQENGRINCWCNANYLVSKLFETMPSVEIKNECKYCSFVTKTEATIPLYNLKFNGENFASVLENYMQNYFDEYESICLTCNSEKKVIKMPKKHLILDVENCFRDLQFSKTIELRFIPSKLRIGDKEYFLIGLVNYLPNHFVALCRYVTGIWIEKNDLREKSTGPINITTKMQPSTLFYVSSE